MKKNQTKSINLNIFVYDLILKNKYTQKPSYIHSYIMSTIKITEFNVTS